MANTLISTSLGRMECQYSLPGTYDRLTSHGIKLQQSSRLTEAIIGLGKFVNNTSQLTIPSPRKPHGKNNPDINFTFFGNALLDSNNTLNPLRSTVQYRKTYKGDGDEMFIEKVSLTEDKADFNPAALSIDGGDISLRKALLGSEFIQPSLFGDIDGEQGSILYRTHYFELSLEVTGIPKPQSQITISAGFKSAQQAKEMDPAAELPFNLNVNHRYYYPTPEQQKTGYYPDSQEIDLFTYRVSGHTMSDAFAESCFNIIGRLLKVTSS